MGVTGRFAPSSVRP